MVMPTVKVIHHHFDSSSLLLFDFGHHAAMIQFTAPQPIIFLSFSAKSKTLIWLY